MHELRCIYLRRIAAVRNKGVPADRKIEDSMSINVWVQFVLLAIAITVMGIILFGLWFSPSS